MALSAKQLERGKALWEDARRCVQGKGELAALRAWAEQCRCAEADRLLAKALLHVAVNGMISWVSENLRKLHSLSMDARIQMQVTLELEAVGLLNEALEVAARGARDHNSLQCFYLACLIAHAVRGRANYVHVVSRVSHLRRLDAKRREWQAAGAPGSAPWADPGAERVIGERAPFETDTRHAAAWATHALQLGGQRLDDALRDEQAFLEHWASMGQAPELKGSTPHAMVFDAAASLLMRLTLLHELVSEERRREWSGLVATGNMRIAGGTGVGRLDAQHKMHQHAAQSLKLQQVQLKLREERERRMAEAAAAATAAGSGGAGGGSGGGSAVPALEKPNQEDLRRYLERRLQDAAAAAADPGGGGKAKGRPRKPPPGLQPPSQPAATAAVAALHSLARAPLAELATAATRLGEQGALPQQTVKRVKDLVGRLAAKDCDSPRGAAGSGARPRLRSGRMFCFPPPEGLPAAAPPPPSRPAGLGSGPGLSQRGKQGQQAKQAEVLCELPTADALTAYLHASYLGEAPAARVAAEPAVGSLLDRVPGVRRLLDRLPRHKRGLQVLRGDRMVEPPAPLPHPGSLTFEGRLAQDVAFVKLALRGPHQRHIPSAEELLAAVKSCAPTLGARAACLGSPDDVAAWRANSGSEVFLGATDGHLRGNFTPLDYYAFKCTALWLPVADSAIDTARIFPHSSDASFPRQVTALAQSMPPGEPDVEAALSRMLLGASMLRALQSRREGHAGGPQEGRIDAVLRRPVLDKPQALLGLLGADVDVALALQGAANDIVRAATAGDAVSEVAPAGASLLLSFAEGESLSDVMDPPVVQVAAAALLASVLARQPPGARFKMDQLNAERQELASSVLAGVQQLLRRQRLSQLAARAICGFVGMALPQAGGQAPSPTSSSLAACLERLGALPLVALAQLAAFVHLLVGRSFLGLADLDPEAFQDLAGGRDLPAELAGCDVQLTDRGLAELLGVPLAAPPGPPGGELRVARTESSSSSGGELQLVRSSSSDGGGGGDDDAAAQQLLSQAAQRLAAYAAPGSGVERERERGGAGVRQCGRPGEGDGACSWTEVLSALQQHAFLAGVLLDLWQWLDTTGAAAFAATTALQSFNRQAMAASKARGQGGALDSTTLAELQGLVAKVTSMLPQSMLALALAGHAWASLQHLVHSSLARQCEDGDGSLGRKLQSRQPSRPAEALVETARAQLRVFRNLQLGIMGQLDKKLQLTEQLAERDGATFVQEQILHGLGPCNNFLRQHEAAQRSGRPGPSAKLAEQASAALEQTTDRAYRALRDLAGMQEQLTGLLDCLHLRTQLLLSELQSRCRVHPPSELMGLALREVLPLQWQQEWRRMQESSSEALMAELLAEEEEEQQQRERSKSQKAAKKKAQKKGAGSEAASTSAASTRGDPDAEAAASEDEEAPTQQPRTAASAAPSAGPRPARGGDELPDRWEALPQTAAEAVAAAERGVPLPPGYVHMLQQLEAEEREEALRRQQEEERAAEAAAEAAAAAAAADAAADQAGKKKRRRKKKDRAPGDAADAAPEAVAAEEQGEEGEGGEWQAVAKKGPRRQQQGQQQQQAQAQQAQQAQQQQQQGQQAQQAHQAQQAQQQGQQQHAQQTSKARVLTVRRSAAHSAPPPLPSLPQPPTPPPGMQAQPQAKEPPQHAQQQQPRQAEQTASSEPPPAAAQGAEPKRHPTQQAQQGQPALGSLWQEPQSQQQPGAATFGSGVPGELPSLPDDLDAGPARRLSAGAQPFAPPGVVQPSARGRALLSAPPEQPSYASHSLFSQPLLGEQQPVQVQLPAQAQHPLPPGVPPEQLPGGLSLAIDPQLPRSPTPLPGGQLQPKPPAQQLLVPPSPGAIGAVAEEEDSMYLHWLGVAEGQASPARTAGTAQAGAAAGGSPPYAPGQQLGLAPPLQPQLDGSLLLEPQLPALPGGGLGGMQQPAGFASALQQGPQAALGLAEAGGSLFSAPLAAQSPPRPLQQESLFSAPAPPLSPARQQLPAFLQAADLPAAALLQQLAAPEPQALGLGGGFGFSDPALDSGTLTAAALAVGLGGTVHEPAPLLAGPLPQQQVQQAQPGLALPSQHEAELDSLYQMLGVSDNSQAPVAAEAWSTSAAHPPPSHTHTSAASSGGMPAAPLGLGGGAAGHAAGQQQPVAGDAEHGLGLAGLRNEAGEYNCFLNVIMQCLWRCAEFRQQVLAWDVAALGHNHVARALHHLFCALRLAATAGSGAPVAVDPSELREALAALPNQLFRLGEMSDAGETLLSMFEQVREASPGTQAILDLLFGLKVAESASCSHCGAVTHQNAYTQFFYNTRASALRRVIAQVAEGRRRGIIGPKTLGARVRAIEEQVYKSCDTDHGGCNKSVPVMTRLEAAPRVFSLQIAWQSNTESPQDIAATLAAVDERLDLAEVYRVDARAGTLRYRLRSMVCYYGQHYQALVLVPEAGGWLMFDDTRVARVGGWAEVLRKCEAGRIQPSVLFYEAEGAV